MSASSLLDRVNGAKKKMSGGKYLSKLEVGKPVIIQIIWDGDDSNYIGDSPRSFGSEQLWFANRGIHYLGKNNEIYCPKVAKDEGCAVCEFLTELYEEESAKKQEVDNLKAAKAPVASVKAAEEELAMIKDQIDNVRAQKKWLINVLVKGEESPRIFTSPWSIHEKIFQTFTSNLQEQNINVLHPKDSYFWKLSREGSGQYDTKYTAELLVSHSPLGGSEESAKKIVAAVYDLDEEVAPTPEAEIAEKLQAYMSGGTSSAPSAPPVPAEEPPVASTPTPGTAAHSLVERLKNAGHKPTAA